MEFLISFLADNFWFEQTAREYQDKESLCYDQDIQKIREVVGFIKEEQGTMLKKKFREPRSKLLEIKIMITDMKGVYISRR